MDAQYPSAGGGEASEFRLDDLFNAIEALQKHPKKDTTRFLWLDVAALHESADPTRTWACTPTASTTDGDRAAFHDPTG